MPFKDPEKRRAKEREYALKRYWKNPEKARAKARKDAARRREKDPEKARRQRNEYYVRSNGPDKRRMRRGVKDPEIREKVMAVQGGKCAICKKGEPGGQGHWHTDHDHSTGLTRGILCASCNLGLGVFKDSRELLQAAIAYLDNPPANSCR